MVAFMPLPGELSNSNEPLIEPIRDDMFDKPIPEYVISGRKPRPLSEYTRSISSANAFIVMLIVVHFECLMLLPTNSHTTR